MIRIIFIFLMCLIVVFLFSGLFHLLRNRGEKGRAVRSLTIRVALSAILFALIVVAAHFGWF